MEQLKLVANYGQLEYNRRRLGMGLYEYLGDECEQPSQVEDCGRGAD